MSKPADEEEAEQEQVLLNQILVKQSQNAMFEICIDVCRQLVPILMVKLCLEESEFDWTCLIRKKKCCHTCSPVWKQERHTMLINHPAGKQIQIIAIIAYFKLSIFWNNNTRWSVNIFNFPYLRNKAKSIIYWNCMWFKNEPKTWDVIAWLTLTVTS